MLKTITVAILFLFVVSCSDLAEDQPLNNYNNTVVLMATTGFYDLKTFSLANVFNTTEFVHGAPSFFLCGFYNKIKYTPRRDKFTNAQIQISLNKLEPKNVEINIHFAQMSLCGSSEAYFLSTIDNDAGSIDTIKTKIDGTTKSISFKTVKASPSGTYYINTMGVNPEAGDCSFAVDRITADYLVSVKK